MGTLLIGVFRGTETQIFANEIICGSRLRLVFSAMIGLHGYYLVWIYRLKWFRRTRCYTIQAMSQPFQCLYKFSGKDQGKRDILAAASGSCIYCFDIASENLVSVWISQQDQEHPLKKAIDADTQEPKDAIPNETAHIDSIRPSKRQKVSSLGQGPGTSADPLLEDDHDWKAESPKAPRPSSAVIKLLGTRNGRYIIAVTEDKCIRILEFSQDSSLKQLSERYNSALNFYYQI